MLKKKLHALMSHSQNKIEAQNTDHRERHEIDNDNEHRADMELTSTKNRSGVRWSVRMGEMKEEGFCGWESLRSGDDPLQWSHTQKVDSCLDSSAYRSH
jgi:hypothetical protein